MRVNHHHCAGEKKFAGENYQYVLLVNRITCKLTPRLQITGFAVPVWQKAGGGTLHKSSCKSDFGLSLTNIRFSRTRRWPELTRSDLQVTGFYVIFLNLLLDSTSSC